MEITQGLIYQQERLAQWKLILNENAYKVLELKVNFWNVTHDYKTGYDVLRGSNIDNIVLYILYENSTKNTHFNFIN